MCVQHSFLIHILLEMKCCRFQDGGSEGRGARVNPQAGVLRYFLSLLHPPCWLSSSLTAIEQVGPALSQRGLHSDPFPEGPKFPIPKGCSSKPRTEALCLQEPAKLGPADSCARVGRWAFDRENRLEDTPHFPSSFHIRS